MDEKNTPPELKAFPIGKLVANRYEVLGYLGHGGMGFVLKARDNVLDGEIVVLKILFPRLKSDATAFARFRREVLLTRKLAHPNIVRIYDFGEADRDTYFISMEYIEGENLRNSLDRFAPKGLPLKQTINFIYQVAQGLSYAHAQGVIHRDIKPANLLISKKFDIKISDFGVARSMESTEKLTATDEAVGSPIYMAPEQLDSNEIDHRSDIYAFGIMTYELLVGSPPFYSDHWVMLVKMHMTQPIPQFASKASGIPFWLQELVNKATTKSPDDRFQSAQEIIKFIANHFDVGDFASDGNTPTPTQPNSATAGSTLWATSLLIVLSLLVVGLGGYFLFSQLPALFTDM